MEDTIMPNQSIRPRILFVTPETSFMTQEGSNQTYSAEANGESFDRFLAELISELFEIPCLFTAQQFDTDRIFLSYVEDRGIDAAAFWQHLFYERYPANCEETRASNPADFLLSGVFAANFVTTSRRAFLANGCHAQSRFDNFPIWQVLANKNESGFVIVDRHRSKTQQYIEIYEKMLQQEIFQPKGDGLSKQQKACPGGR
jgi:hypothetical protein